MHTCANQTGGNISHLEQIVNSFLPYSQQQLGFDKPVKIVFQSDPSNADVLLGKTAHYNPEQFEVYLYTDKRHPKDVMRSLSHELVHHAQNCRGDFGSCNDTSPGYAQRDPHLRKMEREAYTKGNLIFRDFEDLIKRGKITIDINFKDSGEPQMSLKEWKDNELNTLLMKKWGLLSEGTAKEREDEEGNRPSDDKKMDLDEAELEEGGWDRRGPRKKRGWGLDEDEAHPGKSCEEAHPGEKHPVEEGADWEAMADEPDDPTDVPTATALEKSQTKKRGAWGQKVRGKPSAKGKRSQTSAGSRSFGTMGEANDPVEESYLDLARRRGQLHKAIPASEEDHAKYGGQLPDEMMDPKYWREDDPETYRGPAIRDPDDPPLPGRRITDPRDLKRTTTKVPPVSVDEAEEDEIGGRISASALNLTKGLTKNENRRRKVSVKEAKEITRRIIERVRKESK